MHSKESSTKAHIPKTNQYRQLIKNNCEPPPLPPPPQPRSETMADSLQPMDLELADAARTGDYWFLKKRFADCYTEELDFTYFCSRDTSMLPINKGKDGNIFHLSIWENQVDFFKEAMTILPTEIMLQLLSHQEPFIGLEFGKANPLHIAALVGNLTIVRLILDFYNRHPHLALESNNISTSSTSNNDSNSNNFDSHLPPDPPSNNRPWLAQDLRGRTPFHVALEKEKIECALEILSMDGSVATIDSDDGCSPFFVAVEKGYSNVALQMLNSGHSFSISGKHGSSPLHFAVRCSEEVYRRLLERHPHLLNTRNHQGQTVMHTWIRIASHGTVWQFEYLLRNNNDINVPDEWRRDSLELIIAKDEDHQNLLHFTAIYRDAGVAQILVDAYEKERAKESSIFSKEVKVPWLTPNKRGETPLDMAIDLDDEEEVALCFLTPEINSVLHGPDNPLFRAIQKKRYIVAEHILAKQDKFGWSPGLSSGHGRNVLHNASNYTEEIATWLVTKLPFFISKADRDGKTPLHEASKAGADWLVELMLKINQSSLKDASLCVTLPWVEACKNGHVSTIKAFINNCPYFRDHCLEHEDTPLHHIQLGGYIEYKEFLEIPIIKELKDTRNWDGEIPLHVAIMTDNMGLAETLLAMHGKDCRIRNNSGKTPLDLLAMKCTQNPEWKSICKRVGIKPNKGTYVLDESTLLDMRSTLLVVAALLATITFTAGFTLPGGFDNNSGEAILAKNAAFLVFLIADTYAMCCSMLVLLWLIWSIMVRDPDTSLLLVDRSINILVQSLYGTLVAFMTGVATVIFHKSLWAAILIFVMCCIAALLATARNILFNQLDKLVSASDGDGIQNRALQRGNTFQRIRATATRSSNLNDPASNV